MFFIDSEPKLIEYLSQISMTDNFHETGIGNNDYVDIVEICFEAYEYKRLIDMLKTAKESLRRFEEEASLSKCDTDVQSFSRIVLALGILQVHKRKLEMKELWTDMMDVLCSLLKYIKNDGRLDFAIKDTMLCYLLVREHVADILSKKWHNDLSQVNAKEQYRSNFKPSDKPSRPGNVAVYLIAAEAMRGYCGMTCGDEYVDNQIPFHIPYFDENGMYIDPGAPLLYDSATRAQIQIAMHYGYKGKYFYEIDENLRKAGLFSMLMQSASFEFPYGGRSNQYLFNEAYYAANCEYEAKRYKGLNDLKIAGMYKRSAHLAICSIKRWLTKEKVKHIKNMFPWDSGFGTDPYGYYDKYMVSMACFLYIGMLDCDDSIREYPCPAETGGYVFKTSDSFHKVFANLYSKSIEVDVKCDLKHDATGLGRVHKKGIPTELLLSVPFTKNPAYYITERRNLVFEDHKEKITEEDNSNPNALSISSIVNLKDSVFRISEFIEKEAYVITSNTNGFTVKYNINNNDINIIEESYELNKDSIVVTAKACGSNVINLCLSVPLLVTNGHDRTIITYDDNMVRVDLDLYSFTAISNSKFRLKDNIFKNRNGIYKEGIFESDNNEISVVFKI